MKPHIITIWLWVHLSNFAYNTRWNRNPISTTKVPKFCLCFVQCFPHLVIWDGISIGIFQRNQPFRVSVFLSTPSLHPQTRPTHKMFLRKSGIKVLCHHFFPSLLLPPSDEKLAHRNGDNDGEKFAHRKGDGDSDKWSNLIG